MHAPILVAYSTRAGSTADVALEIANILREAHLSVDVARMSELTTLGQYSAAVLGAPLYIGQMPGELHRFLSRFRVQLAPLPQWFFVLGPIEGKPAEFSKAGEQADKQLKKYEWFRPLEVKILGGRFDVNHLPFPYSLARHLPAFPAKDIPAMDVRDWKDIRAWASAIADRFTPRQENLISTLTFTNTSIG
jgi:menaquinone-dependent protoporphyrinogen oxidase